MRTQSGRQLLVQPPQEDGTFTMDPDPAAKVDARGPTAVGQDAAPLPEESDRPGWLSSATGESGASDVDAEAIALDDDDFSVEHDEQSAAGIAPLPPGEQAASADADPEVTLPDVGALFPEGIRPIIPPATTLTQGPVVIGESDPDIADSRVENTQPTGIPNPLLQDWSAQAAVTADTTDEDSAVAAELMAREGLPPEARSTADYPLGFHIPAEDSPEAREIAAQSRRDSRRTVETAAVPTPGIALTEGALDAFADDEGAPSTLEAPVPEWVLRAAAGEDPEGPWGGLGAELAAADAASGVQPPARTDEGDDGIADVTAPDPASDLVQGNVARVEPGAVAPSSQPPFRPAPVASGDPFAGLGGPDLADSEESDGLRETLRDGGPTAAAPDVGGAADNDAPAHFWWSPESEGEKGAESKAFASDVGAIGGSATAVGEPEGYVRGRTAAWPALMPPSASGGAPPGLLSAKPADPSPAVDGDRPTQEDAVPQEILAAKAAVRAAAADARSSAEPETAASQTSQVQGDADEADADDSGVLGADSKAAVASAGADSVQEPPHSEVADSGSSGSSKLGALLVLMALIAVAVVSGLFASGFFDQDNQARVPGTVQSKGAVADSARTANTGTTGAANRALPTVRKATSEPPADAGSSSDGASQAEDAAKVLAVAAAPDASQGGETSDAAAPDVASETLGDAASDVASVPSDDAVNDASTEDVFDEEVPPVVRLDAVSDGARSDAEMAVAAADAGPVKSKVQLAKEAKLQAKAAKLAAIAAKKEAKLRAVADAAAAAKAAKAARLKEAADKAAAIKAAKLRAKQEAAAAKAALKAMTPAQRKAAKKEAAARKKAAKAAAVAAKKQAKLDAIAAKKRVAAEKKAAKAAAVAAKKQAKLDAIAATKRAAAEKKAAKAAAVAAKKQAKLDAIAARKKAAADKKAARVAAARAKKQARIDALAAKKKAAADKKAARIAAVKAKKQAKIEAADAKKRAAAERLAAKKKAAADKRAARIAAIRAAKQAKIDAAAAKKKAAADKKAARIAKLRAAKQAKAEAKAAAAAMSGAEKKAARAAAAQAKRDAKRAAAEAKKKAAADKKAARIAAAQAKKDAKIAAAEAKKKAAADKKAARIAAVQAKRDAKRAAIEAKKKAAADKKAQGKPLEANAKKTGSDVKKVAALARPPIPTDAPSAQDIASLTFEDAPANNDALVKAKALLEGDADIKGVVAWYLRTWAFNKDWAGDVADPMPITFKSCGRKASAWSNRKGIHVCYELIAIFAETFPNYFEDQALRDAIVGASLWVVLHNVAHETARRLDVPNNDASEGDVEDVLAMVLGQRVNDPTAARIIPLVQRGLQAMIRVSAGKYRKTLLKTPAWRNHGLTSGRLRSLMCALYGVSPQPFLLTRFDLKDARAEGCAAEFKKLDATVGKAMAPYMRVR